MIGNELSEEAIRPELATHWLGRTYHYEAHIDSTNDRLKRWVTDGTVVDPPVGTVLLTDFQTSGRGRLGRRWEAPPGSSLLFSALFRPNWPAVRAGWLTMLAGLALAEAIEETTGVAVGLKWPNDLMVKVGDEWRKIGGMLVESSLENGRLAYAILGMGLNVNIPADSLPDSATPAASLQVVTGGFVARRPLFLACLLRLEAWYERADRGESPQPEWNKRLITIGRDVGVSTIDGGPTIVGVVEGTDEMGGLMVRDRAGTIHTVTAGDVTLRVQ